MSVIIIRQSTSAIDPNFYLVTCIEHYVLGKALVLALSALLFFRFVGQTELFDKMNYVLDELSL